MADPTSPVSIPGDDFADLLHRNKIYQRRFTLKGFDGLAHAGVAMVTCMDSRIEPLEMIGLQTGDAKIIRTPGGRLTPDALIGCILGVHLLQVERIMLVPHTRCAFASGDDAGIGEAIRQATGAELGDLVLGASPDQVGKLTEDIETLRNHPLIAGRAQIGGFLYDVDTGGLQQLL